MGMTDPENANRSSSSKSSSGSAVSGASRSTAGKGGASPSAASGSKSGAAQSGTSGKTGSSNGSQSAGPGRGTSMGGPSLGGGATGAGPGRGSSVGGPGLGSGPTGTGGGRGDSIGGPSLGSGPTGTGAGRGNSIGGPSISKTSTGTMAEARALDRASVTGYSADSMSTGLMRAASMAEDHRLSEQKSMADMSVERTLGAIRSAEAGETDPYNRMVGGKPGFDTPDYADLTDMTVREVMDLQKSMIANGHLSTAVGAYQTTAATLSEMVGELGIDLDAKFNEATQDAIAKGLIDRRAAQSVVNGAVDPDRLAESLAKEWASFQTSRGTGYYDGDGINHATVSHETVRGLAGGLVDNGAVGPSTPKSQVANTGNYPETTSALPTSRASFGEKYMGDEKGGFFKGPSSNNTPAEVNVPPSRASISSSFPARPTAPVATGMPAARPAVTRPNPPDRVKDDAVQPSATTYPTTRTKDDEVSRFSAKYLGAPDRTKDDAVERSVRMSANAPDRTKDDSAYGPGLAVAAGTPLDGYEPAFPGRSRSVGGPEVSIDRSSSPANPSQLGGIRTSNPVGMGGPGGMYVGEPPNMRDVDRDDPPSQVAAPSKPSTGFAPPASTPSRPRSPASAPYSQPSAPAPEEDSLPEKVLAGGLDILGGMVPGPIGIGVTVANAGLALTGHKTLGQRIADAIFDGDNRYSPGSRPATSESRMDDRYKPGKSRFAEKYLRPASQVDDGEDEDGAADEPPLFNTTGRPTPYQKWVVGKDSYPAQA